MSIHELAACHIDELATITYMSWQDIIIMYALTTLTQTDLLATQEITGAKCLTYTIYPSACASPKTAVATIAKTESCSTSVIRATVMWGRRCVPTAPLPIWPVVEQREENIASELR